MDFKLLVDQFNKLGFSKEGYVVVGSGSMAAHGIREANDFDILVTEELWNKLASKYPVNKFEDEIENINLGDIQIMGHGSIYLKPEIASLQEMIQTADVVEEINFLRLDLLRKFKQKEGRDKDLKDIALIDEYLKEEKRING
jgi:hypothetical protein